MIVSIQIPTYNQTQFIAQSVSSALEQDYINKQIIVADDASQYDIEGILNAHQSIELYVNEKNKGRVKNYHETLYDHVKGDYFINLDGDDYFTDASFISYAVNILDHHPEWDVLFFQGNHNLEKIKKEIQYKVVDDFTIAVNSCDYLACYHKISEFCHAATLFNTTKAKAIGFYTYDCLYTDFNSAARLMLTDGILLLSSKKVAHWRQHTSNATWTYNPYKFKIECKSIDHIFNELDFKKLKRFLKVKRALKQNLYNHAVFGFDRSRFSLSQIKFIISNSNWNLQSLKVAIRYFLIKFKLKKYHQ